MLLADRCDKCGLVVPMIERHGTQGDGPRIAWFEYHCDCGARGTRPMITILVNPAYLGDVPPL